MSISIYIAGNWNRNKLWRVCFIFHFFLFLFLVSINNCKRPYYFIMFHVSEDFYRQRLFSMFPKQIFKEIGNRMKTNDIFVIISEN